MESRLSVPGDGCRYATRQKELMGVSVSFFYEDNKLNDYPEFRHLPYVYLDALTDKLSIKSFGSFVAWEPGPDGPEYYDAQDFLQVVNKVIAHLDSRPKTQWLTGLEKDQADTLVSDLGELRDCLTKAKEANSRCTLALC